MTLFRREVIERQGSRLEGNVSLALPVSWQAVGILMFCTVIGAFAFLLLGSWAPPLTVDFGQAPSIFALQAANRCISG